MKFRRLECPICKLAINPLEDGKLPPSFPFCSKRCKLMDLGAWAKEEYRIQAENQTEEPSDESPNYQKERK